MNKEDVFLLIKWNIYLLIANGVVLVIVVLISGHNVISYFSTLLLIETAIALLLGSVLEMSASLFFGKIREVNILKFVIALHFFFTRSFCIQCSN